MNTKLIIGNWKMNPASATEANELANKIKSVATDLKNIHTVICPPFVYIDVCKVKSDSDNFHLGAQSVSRDVEGAHTGEVSAKMLKDIGVEYVIAGHSEERSRGDTDDIVSSKLSRLLEVGLKPVVCIGEAMRDPESGIHFDFLREQMRKTFNNIPKKYAKDIVLAYEPVWAIGATEPMLPDQIYETVIFIRKIFSDIFDAKLAMKVPVLYGGSVNYRNAESILLTGKVDGLLVGRESVNITGFSELLKVVDGLQY